jgi:hypothetical protein
MEAILKNTLGLFLLFFHLYSSISQGAISRFPTAKGERLDFSLSLQKQNIKLMGKTFAEYSFVGAKDYSAILYREGFPKLPVIRFYVYADKASDVKIDFSAENEHVQSLRTQATIVPNIPAIPKVKAARAFLTIDMKAYNQNIYPLQDFKIETAGMVKGRKRQLVTIYPLQYLGKKRSLHFRSNFSVEVKTNIDKRNYSYSKPTYLFVIGEKFQNHFELKKYLTHKESEGFEVKKIIVKRNMKTPKIIREEIRKIYLDQLNNLQYVLIVGDHEDVPGHEGQHIYGVTDHFYKCLDTENYEDDINSPDVSLGRLSAGIDSHLKNILDKNLRYEQERIGGSNWLQAASFIATDDQWEIAEATHDYVIDTYMKNQGMSGQFPKANEPGGDQLFAIRHKATRKELLQFLNQGRGIINYSGHGQSTYWMEPELKMDDVKKFNHSEALPMVISNACVTGQFTVSESFAETWQRHSKGSIMFWGSMDNTYWEEDDLLEKRFYDGIYKLKLKEFGAMTDYALSEFWRYYGGAGRSKYYYETYILFADPQIELRTL